MEHGSPPGNFKQTTGTGHHEVWQGDPWGHDGEPDMGWRPSGCGVPDQEGTRDWSGGRAEAESAGDVNHR